MTAYEQGFMTKCAEHGVDGRRLLKVADENPDDWVNALWALPGAAVAARDHFIRKVPLGRAGRVAGIYIPAAVGTYFLGRALINRIRGIGNRFQSKVGKGFGPGAAGRAPNGIAKNQQPPPAPQPQPKSKPVSSPGLSDMPAYGHPPYKPGNSWYLM